MTTTVPAHAAAMPGQSVLNDYGQSDAEVAAEVARAVGTAPAVVAARSKAAAAHQLAVTRTAAEAKTRAAYRAAVKHKHRKAAAKALRVHRRVHALAVAARSADAAAKAACARTVASTTAAIRAKHYRPVDGTYLGSVAQYFIPANGLEPIQVRIVVYGGHVSDITVPQYVSTGESGDYNASALPVLMQRAMAAHDTSTVAAVTGASLTSGAFVKSLSSALVSAGFKG
jgi:uncharacterized protein with FMN-binding domain